MICSFSLCVKGEEEKPRPKRGRRPGSKNKTESKGAMKKRLAELQSIKQAEKKRKTSSATSSGTKFHPSVHNYIFLFFKSQSLFTH